MSTTVAEAEPTTLFDMAGGTAGVRAFVNRFYDLMETEPRYAALRAIHAPDLGPMRSSLAGFLTAWLGGPRDWFETRPGVCMMSAHAPVPVTPETAGQWTEAMARALTDTRIDAELAERMNEAFERMAQVMARR
jgi:hemoglobin